MKDMVDDMVVYKIVLITKGVLLAAFVWFFENIYSVVFLNTFIPEVVKAIMSDLKDIFGFVVALMVMIKLYMQISDLKNGNKTKEK